MNCVIKSRRCVRREGKETGRKGIYRELGCLIDTCTEQNRIRVVVLTELSRIRWTWQNMAECGKLPSDCRRLLANCRLVVVGLFLLRRWEQVEIGGRV